MRIIHLCISLLLAISVLGQKTDSIGIIITNAQQPLIYVNCENWINIDVTDICKANTQLIYRSPDAAISQVNGRRMKIIPMKSDSCHIQVFENDTLHLIATKALKTSDPPCPTVVVTDMNGKPIRKNDEVREDKDIFIQLVPDPTFAKICPNDVKYEISGIELWIQIGLRPPVDVVKTSYIGKDASKGITVHIPNIVEDIPWGARMGVDLIDFVRISPSGNRIILSYWCMKGDNLFEHSRINFIVRQK